MLKNSGQRSILPLLLAVILAPAGCSVRSQNPGSATPVASAAPAARPHCSDRVDRARTGNLVGSVLGTIAASVIGSPFLAVFYKSAGLVMGFASDSPCTKADDPPADGVRVVEKADSPAPSAIIEEQL